MKKWFVALLILCWLAGEAAGQHVTVNFGKDTNFSQYKTYKWVEVADTEHLDELTADQLKGTLEGELARKGLKRLDLDQADLFITLQIASPKDTHVNEYQAALSGGSAGGANSGTAGIRTTIVHTGQLVLSMYDAGKKTIVWHGVVPNFVDPEAKPEKKQKQMDKAVEKLLKDYPPRK